ncbi:hypothetical protein HOI18_03900 [Candidatus Uhrbacteria bacterium]|jgi:hypothetical protein|nr:hypothetical protein [Candidatus Uhrbacteria bacterium]
MKIIAFVICLGISLHTMRVIKSGSSTIKQIDHPSRSYGRRDQADQEIRTIKSSMLFWEILTVGSWVAFIFGHFLL